MGQHDYILSNQTRTSFRSDLNNALAAIVSSNSGATEPATTYAYQFWADTTTGLLKQRNAANSAWITLFTLANGPLDKATANTVLAALNLAKGANVASAATTNIWATDGNLIHVTGTTGITSLGTAVQAGATRTVIFDGVLTLTHNASTLVLPGGSNYTTTANEVIEFIADTTTKIVMKSKSSLASTDTKIAFSVNRNAITQSIPDSATTTIQFNVEAYDIGGCFASYRFTPTVEDVYHLTFSAGFGTSYQTTLYISKNGTAVAANQDTTVALNVSSDVYMNGTTDYIEFRILQVTGAAKNINANTATTFATGHRTYAY